MEIANVVDALLWACLFYMFLGIGFAFYACMKGLAKIDPATRDSPWHFKLLLFPGMVLLWPFLLLQLRK